MNRKNFDDLPEKVKLLIENTIKNMYLDVLEAHFGSLEKDENGQYINTFRK